MDACTMGLYGILFGALGISFVITAPMAQIGRLLLIDKLFNRRKLEESEKRRCFQRYMRLMSIQLAVLLGAGLGVLVLELSCGA